MRILFCLVVIFCTSTVLSLPVIEIPVQPLSLGEVARLEQEYIRHSPNSKLASTKKTCGTNAQKINKEYINHESRATYACSNIRTECDAVATRNLYNNFTQRITYELEFFIENNGNTLSRNANTRVSALMTRINQDYNTAGIAFTAKIYLYGPLLSNGAAWYTNDPCDSSLSQPCYHYISVMNSIAPNLPTPRNNWAKKQAIQVFVADIQSDSSGSTTLGFANFPFMTYSKALVMIPDTIISTDKTLQHELVCFSFLYVEQYFRTDVHL